MYDMSPMMVQITEHRRSFLHFLTGVCAIVGGVFTGKIFCSLNKTYPFRITKKL